MQLHLVLLVAAALPFLLDATTLPVYCGGLNCRFGGTCVADNTAFGKHCDCTNAVDFSGNTFSGTSCATPNCDGAALFSCNGGGSCQYRGSGGVVTQYCVCTGKYTGASCNQVLGPACNGLNCLHGAQCVHSATASGYACQCEPDANGNNWSGSSCQNPTCDGATLNSCYGHGYCTTQYEGGVLTQVCVCTGKYTGTSCNQVLAPGCSGLNCINGGQCVHTTMATLGYACQCLPDANGNNWSGTQCQNPVCDGALHSCSGHGTCGVKYDAATNVHIQYCTCTGAYTGVDCSTLLPSYCNGLSCLNGGQCTRNPAGGYFCACSPDLGGNNWSGPQCAVPACDGNLGTCNGGTCGVKYDAGSLTHIQFCTCNGANTGADCSTPLSSYCGGLNCQNGGQCTRLTTPGSYYCACVPDSNGNTWSGPSCSLYACDALSGCNSPQGTCTTFLNALTNVRVQLCRCLPTWGNSDCGTPTCTTINYPNGCQNGATCTAAPGAVSGTCNCGVDIGGNDWIGVFCQIPTCSALNICNAPTYGICRMSPNPDPTSNGALYQHCECIDATNTSPDCAPPTTQAAATTMPSATSTLP